MSRRPPGAAPGFGRPGKLDRAAAPALKLRLAAADDAAAIAAIYAPYVTASSVSFETEPPDEAAMRARILAGGDLHPWLVALEGDRITAYASASAFRPRPAYRFTIETSIYADRDRLRRGTGRLLYAALLELVERQGFTQAIAAITLPNEPSVRFHEAFGYDRAGTYSRVGWKLGRWHDVGLWQRALAPAAEPPPEPWQISEIGWKPPDER